MPMSQETTRQRALQRLREKYPQYSFDEFIYENSSTPSVYYDENGEPKTTSYNALIARWRRENPQPRTNETRISFKTTIQKKDLIRQFAEMVDMEIGELIENSLYQNLKNWLEIQSRYSTGSDTSDLDLLDEKMIEAFFFSK